MPKKNRNSSKKGSKKVRKKPKMSPRHEKAKRQPTRSTGQKTLPPAKQAVQRPVTDLIGSSREGTGFKIAVDRINGDTIIGDLLVVFPRTREVLQKHGLRLDVEDAGDIYMSLEAFAALQGLDMETLIRELVEASKEPLPQPQGVPAIVTLPTA